MELLAYAFDSTCTFPFEKCLFRYEYNEFVLISGDDDYCEVIQTIIDDEKLRDEVFQKIQKFLFCYGWANHCSFHYVGDAAMGLPNPIDLFNRKSLLRFRRIYRNLKVNFETITSTTTNEQEFALSLYNDARYTNDLFYRFFCFWKILEIPYPGRTLKAADWINDVIKKRCNVGITDYIKDLISNNIDVGHFFKENCRHAIAHIERKPTLISFKAEDYRQIASTCISIERFVEYFIKNEIGIPKYCDRIEIVDKIG